MQPVWDSEDILYADLDMLRVPASRMELDVCGHYARPGRAAPDRAGRMKGASV